MNYNELKVKFQNLFSKNYTDFINIQIEEVKSSNFLVDISKYTSITVTEPKNMVQKFLNEEKIQDLMLGSFDGNFRLSLSFMLELDTLDERRKLDAKLFEEVVKHNTLFRDK